MPIRVPIYLRHGGQIGASQTALKVASIRMPRGGRINRIDVWCRALTGTVSVDVHKNDISVLTATVTPTAGSQVNASLDGTKIAFANGDEIQLKITTAATSTVDDCSVTIDIG